MDCNSKQGLLSFNLKSFFLCELAHRNVSTFYQNEKKKTGFEGVKIQGFG